MPVGGVQSQNPTQGLVHWMSAVMAEHMTSNSHHDPTVGMHYMWNGGVDVSFSGYSHFTVGMYTVHCTVWTSFMANVSSQKKNPKIMFKYRMFDITFPLIHR